jgi:hypothetical protein
MFTLYLAFGTLGFAFIAGFILGHGQGMRDGIAKGENDAFGRNWLRGTSAWIFRKLRATAKRGKVA